MDIPPDVLAKYKAYQISSKEVAAITGYHAVSIRRAIARERPPKPSDQAKNLRRIRDLHRASVAHLPPKLIMAQAHVSISTAYRIKKLYGP